MSALLMLALAAGASPQMHDMHGMGGMHMPGMAMPPRAKPAPKPKAKAKPRPARAAKPAAASAAPACAPEHQAMGHCTPAAPGAAMHDMPVMHDMPGMTMPAPSAAAIAIGS